jgi:hypothetical protein
MKDWRFLDALKRETERSLERQPERQPWGKKVEEVVEEQPTITRHAVSEGERRRGRGRGGRGGHVADRRHRGGTGDVGQGQSGQATDRDDDWWANAKADYERQNPSRPPPPGYRSW